MELYIYKIEYDIFYEREKEILGELLSDRRIKAERLKNKKNRAVSMAAGLVLQKVLREEYGIELRDGDLTAGEHGKLQIKEKAFNISHSGDFVVLAVSDSEIGVDIECKTDPGRRVTERFFTEAEKSYVRNDDDFRRIWTMKEAFIKCLGKGLSIPLRSFSVAKQDEKQAEVKAVDRAADQIVNHSVDQVAGSDRGNKLCGGISTTCEVDIIQEEYFDDPAEICSRIGFDDFDITDGDNRYHLALCTDRNVIKNGYFVKYLGCLFPYKVV